MNYAMIKDEHMMIEIDPEYVPSEDEEYMNLKQLEYFRRLLLNMKQESLRGSAGTISGLAQNSMRMSDLTDNASLEADLHTELVTRGIDYKMIRRIDHCLKFIKSGEYGYCVETGKKIGIKRLLAFPIAILCVEVQERYERGNRRSFDDDYFL